MFSPDPSSAIWLSIIVGAWCVVLGLPVAVAIGWLLARRDFSGKAVLTTVVLAPLVLPPVVTGLLLLRLFGRESALGAWLQSIGISVPFTLAAAVIAALVVGLPLYILAVRGAFESVDRRYEELAQTLGMTPMDAFRQVSIPLAIPGIAAGAMLAFARALGEFGATSVISGNIEGRTRTISLAVYTLLDSPGESTAVGALIWASLALSLGSLIGYEALNRWQKRRLES